MLVQLNDFRLLRHVRVSSPETKKASPHLRDDAVVS
jgi:hypothetical protein